MPTKINSIERATERATHNYSDRSELFQAAYLRRLDCLKNSIVSISEIEQELESHAFDRGAAKAARGLLVMARKALCDHLQGELQGGGRHG